MRYLLSLPYLHYNAQDNVSNSFLPSVAFFSPFLLACERHFFFFFFFFFLLLPSLFLSYLPSFRPCLSCLPFFNIFLVCVTAFLASSVLPSVLPSVACLFMLLVCVTAVLAPSFLPPFLQLPAFLYFSVRNSFSSSFLPSFRPSFSCLPLKKNIFSVCVTAFLAPSFLPSFLPSIERILTRATSLLSSFHSFTALMHERIRLYGSGKPFEPEPDLQRIVCQNSLMVETVQSTGFCRSVPNTA